MTMQEHVPEARTRRLVNAVDAEQRQSWGCQKTHSGRSSRATDPPSTAPTRCAWPSTLGKRPTADETTDVAGDEEQRDANQ